MVPGKNKYFVYLTNEIQNVSNATQKHISWLGLVLLWGDTIWIYLGWLTGSEVQFINFMAEGIVAHKQPGD